ncbi:MFS transporter [Hansschlegelia zhihuaiae]|uniref:MFS transporter n=1 Tax=Hansschlegelia zhihuaiae TaxID=405005 RepID=A0A4Q0MKU1_9HYPH|nr:MFS transporter [Hansschlegelia zhihuaiae]RXF73636.1 MFS transporter [Hansschlegelia zhihuaiae]
MTPLAASPRAVSRRSLAVAAFSTIVEWYDFTLYLYLATVLSRVFLGGGEASLAATLAGFAAAYLLRPLGAIVFGHVGDRFGRRRAMLLSVAVMTAAMLATACLPSYAEIGAWAGWGLLLLRCVTSFAVGGEYVGVVAYLFEGARTERRGLIVSSAAAASEVGALAAVGLSALTVHSLSPAALDAWGWRIPFLAGAALAAVVWVARYAMEESPDFERQRAAGTAPDHPLRFALANHRAGIARGFAISALGSITYYVGITYAPAFLSSTGAFGEGDALVLSTAAAAAVILATPVAGALSDRFGRKPTLALLGLLSAVLPVPMFSLMVGGSTPGALFGAVVLACVAGGVSAVGAVATAEQLPGEGRLTGLALGATAATAVFGGVAPYVAHELMERTGSPLAPGAMIAAVALVVLPVLLRLPERPPDPQTLTDA